MDHQILIDLLPAFALDCLDVDEREQVHQHLETCASCQAELRAYQEVTTQLAGAVPQRNPPASLKQRIMDQALPQPVKKEQTALNWWARLAHVLLPPTPTLRWVTVLVILILAAGNVFLFQKLNQAQSAQAIDFRTVELVGTTNAPGAGGVLLISSNGRFGTLLADGMPTLKPNQVFQLWLIKNGKRTSGGIFTVNPDGYGTLIIKPGQSLLDYTACGITIEPAGGSPAPTGAKVLGGNL